MGMSSNGFIRKPFIIGVAGGSASGKTSVCSKIIERLELKNNLKPIDENDIINNHNVGVLCMDSFYRDLNPEEKIIASNRQFNFDHPDALDIETLKEQLLQMSCRKTVKIPVYDYKNNCKKTDEYIKIPPSDVILCEGILIFYFSEIRELFDMKLFVDTDADIRLARRVQRDIIERGRNLEGILKQYLQFVKPAFEEFCLPTKKYADIIIPRGAENSVAIDLIVQHIKDYLKNANYENGYNFRRSRHHSDSML